MSSNPQLLSQPPAGLWGALQASSSRNRPKPRSLASFENGISDLIEADGAETFNKHDLLCPREGCASIILKKGVGKLKEGQSIQDIPAHPLLPALPSSSESTQWWLITPSPMQFENIGFSRPVQSLSLSPSGNKLKLLACAECDLGPLGWSEEGGSEFWLACSRIGYRDE